MDWFLYDNGLRHERVKTYKTTIKQMYSCATLLMKTFLFGPLQLYKLYLYC